MTLRLQNTCGHGGTRVKHVLVCAEHELRPPVPGWQKGLLVLALASVALFVGRVEMPGVPAPRRTIMDVSRLDLKTPAGHPEKAAAARRPPPPKIVVAVEAPTRGALPLRAAKERPVGALRHEVPALGETDRPAIVRSFGYASASQAPLEPVVVRLRRAPEEVEAGGGAPKRGMRLRREAEAIEAERGAPTPQSTYIYRNRGSRAETPVPSAPEAVELPTRVSPAAEAALAAPLPRVAAVRPPPALPAAERKPAAVALVRERSASPSGSGAGASAVALSRGVSLMSLKICDSALQQEEAVKAVLSVVGSRRSCTSEKGEYLFKETRRVSSFNLIIFPARGREPSQRCEELEYAYQCLKKN